MAKEILSGLVDQIKGESIRMRGISKVRYTMCGSSNTTIAWNYRFWLDNCEHHYDTYDLAKLREETSGYEYVYLRSIRTDGEFKAAVSALLEKSRGEVLKFFSKELTAPCMIDDSIEAEAKLIRMADFLTYLSTNYYMHDEWYSFCGIPGSCVEVIDCYYRKLLNTTCIASTVFSYIFNYMGYNAQYALNIEPEQVCEYNWKALAPFVGQGSLKHIGVPLTGRRDVPDYMDDSHFDDVSAYVKPFSKIMGYYWDAALDKCYMVLREDEGATTERESGAINDIQHYKETYVEVPESEKFAAIKKSWLEAKPARDGKKMEAEFWERIEKCEQR